MAFGEGVAQGQNNFAQPFAIDRPDVASLSVRLELAESVMRPAEVEGPDGLDVLVAGPRRDGENGVVDVVEVFLALEWLGTHPYEAHHGEDRAALPAGQEHKVTIPIGATHTITLTPEAAPPGPEGADPDPNYEDTRDLGVRTIKIYAADYRIYVNGTASSTMDRQQAKEEEAEKDDVIYLLPGQPADPAAPPLPDAPIPPEPFSGTVEADIRSAIDLTLYLSGHPLDLPHVQFGVDKFTGKTGSILSTSLVPLRPSPQEDGTWVAAVEVLTHTGDTEDLTVRALTAQLTIMKPDTDSPSQWMDPKMAWTEHLDDNSRGYMPLRVKNEDNPDELRFKLTFAGAPVADALIGSDRLHTEITYHLSADVQPNELEWFSLAEEGDWEASHDNTELWCVVPGEELLQKLDAMPVAGAELRHAPVVATFDFPSENAHFHDANAFEAMSSQRLQALVGPRVRDEGNWTDAEVEVPNRGPAGAWSSAANPGLFRAGGAIFLQVRVGDAVDRCTVGRRATAFYFSSHGHSACGRVEVGMNDDGTKMKIDPEDLNWGPEMRLVIFSACSVLNVDELRRNFEGDLTKAHGRRWAATGPEVLLGYNGGAPGDSHKEGGVFDRSPEASPTTMIVNEFCNNILQTETNRQLAVV